MTDIVKRLRTPPFDTETSERNLMSSAADEIDRLRAERDALNEEIVTLRAAQVKVGLRGALTKKDREFLYRVANGLRLGSPDRAEDRARQRMRRSGLAEVVMNPRRWVITDAGRATLQEMDLDSEAGA